MKPSVSLTFKDIDRLHESWDKEKHKHLIEYVADTLKCKIKDVPLIYMDWCVAKANTLIAEEMEDKRAREGCDLILEDED